MKLSDYTREQLLALQPGPELDGLLIRLDFWDDWDEPSRSMQCVGYMLEKLREFWPMYCFGPSGKAFTVWGNGPLSHDNVIGPLYAPHVCALALVLAVREKEKKE